MLAGYREQKGKNVGYLLRNDEFVKMIKELKIERKRKRLKRTVTNKEEELARSCNEWRSYTDESPALKYNDDACRLYTMYLILFKIYNLYKYSILPNKRILLYSTGLLIFILNKKILKKYFASSKLFIFFYHRLINSLSQIGIWTHIYQRCTQRVGVPVYTMTTFQRTQNMYSQHQIKL